MFYMTALGLKYFSLISRHFKISFSFRCEPQLLPDFENYPTESEETSFEFAEEEEKSMDPKYPIQEFPMVGQCSPNFPMSPCSVRYVTSDSGTTAFY